MSDLKRWLYVTEEISGVLDGGHRSFPHVAADTLITRFLAGQMLTYSGERRKWGRRGDGPTLERLEGLDEIWTLCFRKPPPGWRLLGRFLEKGVFVGLKLIDKHDLAGNYSSVAGDVINEWERLFNISPLRSASVDDYVDSWTEYG
jgi:hypothetical protein